MSASKARSAEWLRKYKARLLELGYPAVRIDDYCNECGPPDSDAIRLDPVELANESHKCGDLNEQH